MKYFSATMSLISFIACVYLTYVGFNGKLSPFAQGIGWLSLAVVNLINFASTLMNSKMEKRKQKYE